jgi:uncharacterized protein (TIGR02118 family)
MTSLKVVYLVEKRPELSDAEFLDHWHGVHAELAMRMPGLLGYSINAPSPLQRGTRPIDGFAALWFADRDAAKAAWASPEGKATADDGLEFMAGTRALIVDERRVVPSPPKGCNVVYLVEKRPELSDAEFLDHWHGVHAELAMRMPGLLGYSINAPSPLQRGTRPIDGFAALWFADRDAAKAAWASPEGKATADDGLEFMASTRALIVDERVVLALDEGAPSGPT